VNKINASTQTPNWTPMRDAFVQVGQDIDHNEKGIQTEGKLYHYEPQSPNGKNKCFPIYICLTIYALYPASSLADVNSYTSESSDTEVELNESSSSSTLCYVSHVNSPSHFFVQFAEKSDQVDSVTRMLQETDLEPLSSGQIESGVRCVAKYPLDGCFYRAEILSVFADGQIFVSFIDFGNTSPVIDLRQLPECMTFPSRLAIACKLDLPAGKVWANGATKIFSEMAHDGNIEFEIEVLEDGERCTVNLHIGDENVVDSLVVADEPRRSLQLEPILEETDDGPEDEEACNAGAACVSEEPVRLERAIDEDNHSMCEEDAEAVEVSCQAEGHEMSAKDGKGEILETIEQINEFLFSSESTGSSSSTEGGDKAQVVNVNSVTDFHVTIQDNAHDLSKLCK
jgi:Tudor domain